MENDPSPRVLHLHIYIPSITGLPYESVTTNSQTTQMLTQPEVVPSGTSHGCGRRISHHLRESQSSASRAILEGRDWQVGVGMRNRAGGQHMKRLRREMRERPLLFLRRPCSRLEEAAAGCRTVVAIPNPLIPYIALSVSGSIFRHVSILETTSPQSGLGQRYDPTQFSAGISRRWCERKGMPSARAES